MKRLISLFLVVAMLFSMTVFAAEGTLTVTVDMITAAAGETVTVPIRLSGNTGILSLEFSIEYDSKLVLTDITKGSALPLMAMTKPGDLSANPFKLLLDAQDMDATNGIIINLTFDVPDEAGLFEISISEQYAFDGADEVSVAVEDGSITVPGVVTEASLSGSVTAPVKNATDASALIGTNVIAGVSWVPELVENKFAPNTVYTATITVSPEGGYLFADNVNISFEDYFFAKNCDGNYVAAKTFPDSSTKVSYSGIEATTPTTDSYSIVGVPATVTLLQQSIAGETVEYAKGSTATALESGWQDSHIFSGLEAGEYYFFARVKENEDHVAGTASAASSKVAIIEATQELSITVPVFDAVDYGYGAVSAKSITITNSGNSAASIVNVAVSDDSKFTVSGSGGTVSENNGRIDTWEVAPAAGLDAGTYSTVITVTYDADKTATATVSFTINKKAISINDVDSIVTAKTYDGADSAVITSVAFAGLEGGQTLSLTTDYTVSNANFNSANVNDATTVTAVIALVEDGPTAKNYTLIDGALTKTSTITPKSIPVDAIQTIGDQAYTGQAITPALVVKDGSTTLALPNDYTVTDHGNNTAVGTNASVTITGVGNYTGTATKTFNIVGADYTYSVAETQNIKVGSGLSAITVVPISGTGINDAAVDGTHSWFSDSNHSITAQNADISSAPVGSTVTLYWSFNASTANYSTAPKTGVTVFSIVEGDPQTLAFTGVTANAVTKTYGDGNFTEIAANSSPVGGAVTYISSNPTVATIGASSGTVEILKAGTTTITATAAAVSGQWAETSVSYTLTVNPKTIVIDAANSVISSKIYDGFDSAEITSVAFTDLEDSPLTLGTDYTVTNAKYNSANVTTADTVTATITLTNSATASNYTLSSGVFSKTASITAKALPSNAIQEIADQQYTGQTITPTLVVKDGNTTLIFSDDYTVTDHSNNTNASADASVTIAGAGNYSGTATKTFNIIGADYYYSVAGVQNVKVGSGLSAITVVPANGTGISDAAVSGIHTWFSDSGHNTEAQNADISSVPVGSAVTLYWSFTASTVNYITTPKTGATVFTIVEGDPQTLAFDGVTENAVTKTYGDNTFLQTVTQSAGSGTISYTSATPAVASVASDGTVTIYKAGTTTIIATAAAVLGQWAETSVSYTLTVNPKNVSSMMIGMITDPFYTGSAITPEPTITDGSVLTQGTDFEFSYENNTNAGTATLTIAGKGNYTGIAAKAFTIAKADAPIVSDIGHEYNKDNVTTGVSIDLAALLPNNCGTASYNLTKLGIAATSSAVVDNDGILTFDTIAGNDGDEEELSIEVTMQNYENVTIKVTIILIDKITPVGTPSVTGSLSYGQALSNLSISAAMTDGAGGTVDGEIIWESPVSIPVVGAPAQTWVFKPEDDDTYTSAYGTIVITVNKSTPVGTPTYDKINTSGKTLADANLDGAFTNAYSGEPVHGTLIWAAGDAEAVTENKSYGWIFTPNDTDNYNVATGSITVYTSGGGYTPSNPPADGKTEIIGNSTVTTPAGKDPVTNDDGTVTLPGGGTVEVGSGGNAVVVDAPAGTVVAINGSVTIPDNKEADVELTDSNATVTVPGGSTISSSGAITVGNGEARITLPNKTEITIPEGSSIAGNRVNIGDGGATVTIGGASTTIVGGVILILDEFLPLGYYVVNLFNDVKSSDWFYDAVMYAYENGIMNGTGSSTFEPNVNLNRAMMVQIIYNYEGRPFAGASDFDDVSSNAWYADAVAWAADKKIVEGYGDGDFGPLDEITREQMAVILYRYCNSKGINLPATRSSGSFTDNVSSSSWATEAVDVMYKAEILNGKGNGIFDPQGKATRAEAAQIMMNFLEAIK